MGSKKNVDMSSTQDAVKVVEDQDTTESKKVTKKKVSRARSKKYVATRAQVDKTRTYDAFSAIELLKRLSYAKFDGTITADLVLREAGESVSLTLPHATGKSVRVAIMSDAVMKDIEAGKIEFDVLVSTPQFMPKLAKHAKVLGPKGLMPNPKSGTLTENPEKKKQELEGGKMTIKTEKKAPLMHIVIGKVSMETKDLVENIQALTKVLKGRLVKLSISASMSPGVKVVTE